MYQPVMNGECNIGACMFMNKYDVMVVYQRTVEAESISQLLKRVEEQGFIDELDRKSIEIIEVKE